MIFKNSRIYRTIIASWAKLPQQTPFPWHYFPSPPLNGAMISHAKCTTRFWNPLLALLPSLSCPVITHSLMAPHDSLSAKTRDIAVLRRRCQKEQTVKPETVYKWVLLLFEDSWHTMHAHVAASWWPRRLSRPDLMWGYKSLRLRHRNDLTAPAPVGNFAQVWPTRGDLGGIFWVDLRSQECGGKGDYGKSWIKLDQLEDYATSKKLKSERIRIIRQVQRICE